MKSLNWKWAILFSAALYFGGCSTSPKIGEEGDSAPEAVVEVGADATTPDSTNTETPVVSPEATPDVAVNPTVEEVAPDALPSPVPPLENPELSAVPPLAEPPAPPIAEPQVPAAPEEVVHEDVKVDYGTYVVKNGDTLMKISFKTYGTVFKWKEIFEANRDQIPNPQAISTGLKLKVAKTQAVVPVHGQGEKYRIQTGDTLGTISDTLYGTTSKWKVLWKNNKELIPNPNRIFAGFYLYYVPMEHSSFDHSRSSFDHPHQSLSVKPQQRANTQKLDLVVNMDALPPIPVISFSSDVQTTPSDVQTTPVEAFAPNLSTESQH